MDGGFSRVGKAPLYWYVSWRMLLVRGDGFLEAEHYRIGSIFALQRMCGL